MTKKNVVIIGSGFVAGPIIKHLVKNKSINLSVASLLVEDVEEVTRNIDGIKKFQLDISHQPSLKRILKDNDIVVSLLPAHLHLSVAEMALATNTHFVNTSYLSESIKKMAPRVISKNLIFINECGMDPGLDHMSTMSMIDQLTKKKYRIESYESYGSGIPAPEDNNNPWGYKFSWSPRGVIAASKNPARYLKDGIMIDKSPGTIFNCPWEVKVQGLPILEAYPNRDSISYIDLYSLNEVKSMVRGTLRNPGWSDTWRFLYSQGLLNEFQLTKTPATRREFFDILTENRYKNLSKKKLLKSLLPFTNIDVLNKLDWLGLFDTQKIKAGITNTIDILTRILEEKLVYAKEEKDMIILHHIIKARNAKGKLKTFKSTIISKGDPKGDFAMARAVTIPAALAVESIISGEISTPGVHIPVTREIYKAILSKIKKHGITVRESKIP